MHTHVYMAWTIKELLKSYQLATVANISRNRSNAIPLKFWYLSMQINVVRWRNFIPCSTFHPVSNIPNNRLNAARLENLQYHYCWYQHDLFTKQSFYKMTQYTYLLFFIQKKTKLLQYVSVYLLTSLSIKQSFYKVIQHIYLHILYTKQKAFTMSQYIYLHLSI